MRRVFVAFLAFGLAACGEVKVPALPDLGEDAVVPDVAIDAIPDAATDTSGDPGTDVIACSGDKDCPALPLGSVCRTRTCNLSTHQCVDAMELVDTACVPPGGPPAACNEAACDGGGACVVKAMTSGVSCQGTGATDPCTTYTCQSGECRPSATPCDDGNPCTQDVCGADKKCSHTPLNGGACDDGDACTENESCFAGQCLGTSKACDDADPCTRNLCSKSTGCIYPPLDTGACDDGNPCTVGDVCQGGKCQAGTGSPCSDGNPCTDDSCDPSTGKCLFTPNSATCSDGNPCTGDDSCLGGICVGSGAVNCDDGQPCTDDQCDPSQGCLHPILPNCLTCTVNSDCNDGDPCTVDVCDTASAKCANTPATGTACDDHNPCTVGDACQDGKCIAGAPKDCSDNNACTDDTCNPGDGTCLHASTLGLCDDKNACTTGDTCAGGQCAGTAVGCDDKNPCTDDACDSANGKCVFTANTVLCDDKNPCTLNDRCKEGSCQGTQNLCDDGNPCTVDSCDVTGGCTNLLLGGCLSCQDDSQCDDGNVCTQDACGGGQCQWTPLGSGTCDDGNRCTTSDTCSGGKCVGGVTLFCQNDNPCLTAACDPSIGCVTTPIGGTCEDGDACTGPDTCSNGTCIPGPLICCDKQPDGTACSDQDPATAPDTCLNGHCLGFKKVSYSTGAGKPTWFTDVDATLKRVYAVGYDSTEFGGAKDGFITHLPFGAAPDAPEAMAKGRPYRSVSRGLAVGDGGLVAYRYSWVDGSWTVGGVLGTAMGADGNPPTDLAGAFSVAGGCASGVLCAHADMYLATGTQVDPGTAVSSAWAKLCVLNVSSSGTATATCQPSSFAKDPTNMHSVGATGAAGTCCYVVPCLKPIPCMEEALFGGAGLKAAAAYGVSLKSLAVPTWAGGNVFSMWTPRDVGRVGGTSATSPSLGAYLVVGDSGMVMKGDLTFAFSYVKIVDGQDSYTFRSIDARNTYTLILASRPGAASGMTEWVLLMHPNAVKLEDATSWVVVPIAKCGGLMACALDLAAVSGDSSGIYVVGTDSSSKTPVGVVYYLPSP